MNDIPLHVVNSKISQSAFCHIINGDDDERILKNLSWMRMKLKKKVSDFENISSNKNLIENPFVVMVTEILAYASKFPFR